VQRVHLRSWKCVSFRGDALDAIGPGRERGQKKMRSDSGIIKPLQFDTAIPSVPAEADGTQQGVSCIACRRPLRDQYYDVDGQSACRSCRDEIARLAETPREWGVFARACLFGFVAAILGAIVYYAVIAITNFEIGIVAIAIGYMVGYGIRMATKGRGGRRFQVAALVLTYWAVGLAYMPLIMAEMSKEEETQQASADTTEPGEASAIADSADIAETADTPAAPAAVDGLNLPLAFAVLVGFSFALPVLAVVSSLPGGLISAAIIAFGMQQAWHMTAAPQPQITGPYRIGAGPRAPA
jgi:hypothetical protein